MSLSCFTYQTLFIWVEKVGQAVLRCPAFWQRKHKPFSMQRFHSSGVRREILMTSTSIASGSRVLEGVGWEKE